MYAPSQTIPDDDLYPDSDGKPMAETGIHVLAIIWLHQMLRHHFRDREDVYVAANMYLYYAEGQPRKRRAPDILVAQRVRGRHERRSFKTWVEGVVPSCILEVTSKKTTQEDLKEKKPTYQRIGVREYFLFDPLEDYLPEQLLGYRLLAKKYQRIKPNADGSLTSKELGLHLLPVGDKLMLIDTRTGERVPNPDELYEASTALSRKLKEESQRNAELRAEIERLRGSNGKGRK